MSDLTIIPIDEVGENLQKIERAAAQGPLSAMGEHNRRVYRTILKYKSQRVEVWSDQLR